MKTGNYILGVLVFLLFSCTDNSVLNLPAPAVKIVVNSLLIANETPKVYVGKTWSVTEPTPVKTYYENARVEIWEDNTLSDILVFNNGFYILPNFVLKPQKSYVIRVEVPNIGKVESKPVIVPVDVDILKISLDPNIKWITRDVLIQKPLLIQLFIDNTTTMLQNYLVMSAVAVKDNNKLIFNTLTTENVEISSSSLSFSTNNCYALFPELSGFKDKRSIGYNMQCFLEQKKEIGLVIDRIGQLANKRVEADFVEVYFATYSAEYLQYAKAAEAIEGADNAFIETKPTYTNIVGGIGFVAAINQKKLIIKL